MSKFCFLVFFFFQIVDSVFAAAVASLANRHTSHNLSEILDDKTDDADFIITISTILDTKNWYILTYSLVISKLMAYTNSATLSHDFIVVVGPVINIGNDDWDTSQHPKEKTRWQIL